MTTLNDMMSMMLKKFVFPRLSALSVDCTIGTVHFDLTVEEIDNELYAAGVIFGIYSKYDLII